MKFEKWKFYADSRNLSNEINYWLEFIEKNEQWYKFINSYGKEVYYSSHWATKLVECAYKVDKFY